MTSSRVPTRRVRTATDSGTNPDGSFVLYWMIGQRRLEWNFALQRAVERANAMGKPLVIFEALRCDYRWASHRFHRFVLEGMAEHHEHVAGLSGPAPAYFSFVERAAGEGRGLLEALAEQAALVVTDECASFFLPRMVNAATQRLQVETEVVDSNGLLPLRSTDKVFSRAYDFRRFLQRELAPHLLQMPDTAPLAHLERGPDEPTLKHLEAVGARWQPADRSELEEPTALLATLPIDSSVGAAPQSGGTRAGRHRLQRFLEHDLDAYVDRRNDLDHRATSEVSSYLHFGHLSSHEIFCGVAEREAWSPFQLSESASGARSGWWGMSEAAESYLDQLVTWRELGANMASKRPDHASFDSLPAWALRTIDEHRSDPRPHLYSLEQLTSADTHDELWNAAQRELVREGRIHNYLRMLWGKKIYQWSATAEEAVEAMIELNDRFALDGRDPNSVSGIFWCLGRYDRAWGPERPIFGKLRYMSSRNTRRKLRTRGYLERFSE